MWNFPNCVGAIKGKDVVIQAPRCGGSSHFNYKGTHSLVLLAVCDASYRFTMINVGDAGRHSDGVVLTNSHFSKALQEGSLHLPADCALQESAAPKVPYVFVGD